VCANCKIGAAAVEAATTKVYRREAEDAEKGKRFNTEGTEQRRRTQRKITAYSYFRDNFKYARPALRDGRYKFRCNINGEELAVLTSWQVGAQQAAPLPTVPSDVARIGNWEIDVPRMEPEHSQEWLCHECSTRRHARLANW
jgi:hypothetical protein